MTGLHPRIVSLLGSATEVIHQLGLGDHLVGISHECDHPPEALGLPRLSRPAFDPSGLDSGEIDSAVRRALEEHGSVYTIDQELLESLAPDLVLTQALCEVCAVPTGSVEAAVAALDRRVEVVSLDVHTIEDLFGTLARVAHAAGRPEAADEAVGRLRNRLDATAERVAGAPRPRVLLLEWLDPPFAPGHWVPEMVTLAGGENLLGTAGARSVEVAWEPLEGHDPDVVLIEPCGFDLDAAAADLSRHADRVRRVAPRAFDKGDVWLLHSGWFSRSGPRIVAGIEALARIFHPERFAEPPDARIARRATLG